LKVVGALIIVCNLDSKENLQNMTKKLTI
jgi:hypothetical protein